MSISTIFSILLSLVFIFFMNPSYAQNLNTNHSAEITDPLKIKPLPIIQSAPNPCAAISSEVQSWLVDSYSKLLAQSSETLSVRSNDMLSQEISQFIYIIISLQESGYRINVWIEKTKTILNRFDLRRRVQNFSEPLFPQLKILNQCN